MKKIKSFYLIFYYLLIICIIFFAIYHREIIKFLSRNRDSKEGLLLGIFNKLALYFEYADKWNFVFIVFFVCILLILFVINDLATRHFFQKLAHKSKSFGFLNKDFSRDIIQKAFSGLALLIEVILILNLIIIVYAHKNSLDHPRQVAGKKVVLLLGTNKHIKGTDKENLYYTHRINACIELYKAGVVDYFIISGDKTGKDYNEPEDMRKDLISLGVQQKQIKLDTAGFRTLDSILRLRSIFGIQEVIIVSQNFHIQRAVFLSWFYRLKAWGYKADGSMTPAMIKREIFAKPKVILDLFFFNMQPKIKHAQYRAEFKVTSDLHVLLILLLTILLIMSFTLVIKSFDAKT